MSTYTTDGLIVRDESGGCMGIFSTVSMLNDKIEEISRLSRIVKVYENAIKTAVGFEPFGGLEPRILSGALAKGEETKKANAEK